MPGVPDPLYVRARAALLDAVEALSLHRNALVLVGAQAVYLHTGNADLAVAEYTTDADFTVSPADLADAPLLTDLLGARGFTPRQHPGGWLSPDGIYIDIMVPEALAGPGGRGARLGPHGTRAARRAKGLEGALVDRERRGIGALEPDDPRVVELWIAGPGALLVAKVHKIAERVAAQDRIRDKDALDVLRLPARGRDARHRTPCRHPSPVRPRRRRDAPGGGSPRHALRRPWCRGRRPGGARRRRGRGCSRDCCVVWGPRR
jgi:hypothetical protein